MTTIVLLPGMDGTGYLFEDFAKALNVNSIAVGYPLDEPLGYIALEQRILASLPEDEPFIVLGESFSGPLAISIAAKRPRNLRAVILVCTFARLPLPRIPFWLQRLIGASPFYRVPITFTAHSVLGSFYTREAEVRLAQVHDAVLPEVWKARLRAVMAVDYSPLLNRIEVPLLYLRALHDRVVFAPASALISKHVPSAKVVDVDGPHFLLQTKPAECAAIVRAFMQEHGIAF